MKLEDFINNYKRNLKGNLIMLIVIGSLVVLMFAFYTLSKDLGLENFGKYTGSFVFCGFLYVLYEFVMLVAFLICNKVKEKKDKKLEIEKIIEEESKKD